ncbi:MAG TPA: aromatic-ring-hydroxylating dioxygenase subunit beta [Alphaproteobacteria bacterium]|jgi:3-phenylpropionate/cinnamic acid dioxygenase small subunit
MADESIERFLYREARLMDEHRYAEWLALWADDACYWVPCNDDDIDPMREVSIIYDDRERLEQRIERLMSGSVLAQDPKPRMRRVVSNIEVEDTGGAEVLVQSNFILGVARGETQQIWAGRTIHKLRRTGADFKIVHKKVMLINADQEMPLLQFLI